MGSGRWTSDSFVTYSASRGRSVSYDGTVKGSHTAQSMFVSRKIDPALDPKNVVRECRDSEEHPNTIPVILALDVTGSMGNASVEVAKKLNVVMTKLYDKIEDVEFMIMGIGDLAYDRAPIQVSQYESDIRIAEQLDKIYFEGGGGGNDFESYTAAWYFALYHTKLDCHARNKKGIIITMGDEPLNPYLPKEPLSSVTGDTVQADVETKELYRKVSEKFDIYHLNVQHGYTHYADKINSTFGEYLDGEHFKNVSIDSISNTIIEIVASYAKESQSAEPAFDSSGLISW